MISMTVTGETRSPGDIDPATLLLLALRDTPGLAGTKYGCGAAQCGARTVLIDDSSGRSCLLQRSGG